MSNDKVTPEKRSWIMSRVKSENTSPEMKLRKILWGKGLRYTVHNRTIIGKPDLVFKRSKIAIFIDGAFWHGKKLSEERLSKMSLYWQNKIRRNMERDIRINDELRKMGYTVIRFLDTEVIKNTPEVVEAITRKIREKSV